MTARAIRLVEILRSTAPPARPRAAAGEYAQALGDLLADARDELAGDELAAFLAEAARLLRALSPPDERALDRRLYAVVRLAGSLEVAEALLAGVGVPARRLDPELARALGLAGDVVLDDELALRVAAHGPEDAA